MTTMTEAEMTEAEKKEKLTQRAAKLTERTLKTIGENVKARREAIGLSQRQLADKVGLSVSYISMVERAERSASMEALAGIALALRLKAVTDLHAPAGK